MSDGQLQLQLLFWMAFFSAMPNFAELGVMPLSGPPAVLPSATYIDEGAVNNYIDEAAANNYVTET
jgi:hypothetical protein